MFPWNSLGFLCDFALFVGALFVGRLAITDEPHRVNDLAANNYADATLEAVLGMRSLAGVSIVAIGSGHPQYVCLAAVVQTPRQHEKQVGKPVYVAQGRRVQCFALIKRHHFPLGAPHNGAGQVKMAGGRTTARQDEARQRFEVGVYGIDFLLKSVGLGVYDTQCAVVVSGCGQIGAEVKQVVLQSRQYIVVGVAGVVAGQPDRGVRFIHSAYRRKTLIGLYPSFTAGQRGFALVAAARIDFRQFDHREFLAPAEDDQNHDQGDGDELGDYAQSHQLV